MDNGGDDLHSLEDVRDLAIHRSTKPYKTSKVHKNKQNKPANGFSESLKDSSESFSDEVDGQMEVVFDTYSTNSFRGFSSNVFR